MGIAAAHASLRIGLGKAGAACRMIRWRAQAARHFFAYFSANETAVSNIPMNIPKPISAAINT